MAGDARISGHRSTKKEAGGAENYIYPVIGAETVNQDYRIKRHIRLARQGNRVCGKRNSGLRREKKTEVGENANANVTLETSGRARQAGIDQKIGKKNWGKGRGVIIQNRKGLQRLKVALPFFREETESIGMPSEWFVAGEHWVGMSSNCGIDRESGGNRIDKQRGV